MTAIVFENAKLALAKKKPTLDLCNTNLVNITEGLCVQIMHTGSYDDEPKSIELMKQYTLENGYIEDFSKDRLHHEIYLSDPRRCAPERLKTIIRHPVKKITL